MQPRLCRCVLPHVSQQIKMRWKLLFFFCRLTIRMLFQTHSWFVSVCFSCVGAASLQSWVLGAHPRRVNDELCSFASHFLLHMHTCTSLTQTITEDIWAWLFCPPQFVTAVNLKWVPLCNPPLPHHRINGFGFRGVTLLSQFPPV